MPVWSFTYVIGKCLSRVEETLRQLLYFNMVCVLLTHVNINSLRDHHRGGLFDSNNWHRITGFQCRQTTDWMRSNSVPDSNSTTAVRVGEGARVYSHGPSRPGRTKCNPWWLRFPSSGIKTRPQVRPRVDRGVVGSIVGQNAGLHCTSPPPVNTEETRRGLDLLADLRSDQGKFLKF